MTQLQDKPNRLSLKGLVAEDRDLMRKLVREAMQDILEAEMTEALAAVPGARTHERLGYRAGHYPRTLITRVGKLELRVPQGGRDLLIAPITLLRTGGVAYADNEGIVPPL
jgi:putative transposase